MSTISREAVMKEISKMIEERKDNLATMLTIKSRIESIPQEPTDEWVSIEN